MDKKPKSVFDEMNETINNFGTALSKMMGIEEEEQIEFDCEVGMSKEAQERMKSFDLISKLSVAIKTNIDVTEKAWMLVNLCDEFRVEANRLCEEEN